MKTNLQQGVILLLALCAAQAQVRAPAIPSPPSPSADAPSEFLDLRPDGGYRFGYSTGDFGQHQHAAEGSPDGRVAGRYSERGRQTSYTAGPRGFRARGTHIARRMDLSQNRIPYNPPVSPDSPAYNPTYSGYHDPNEDPSYSFGFRTPTYNRQENSNSNAEVTGQYSYVDDVGERHLVDYIAGSRTGFHVKTPFPDSIQSTGALFVRAPGKPGQKPRGRTAIQRGLDGSYRFTAAGPDQRRVEVSDATGHVRGSYTYLDDKGVQRTTEYIAGPNIGYKVINSKKGPSYPYLPSGFPSSLTSGKDNINRPVDDLFDLPEGLNTAESGAGIKPPKKGKPGSDESLEDISSSSESGGGSHSSVGNKPSKDSTSSASGGDDDFLLSLDESSGSHGKPTSGYGTSDSSPSSESPDDDGDIFGKPAGGFQTPGSFGYDNIGAGLTKPNIDNDDIFGSLPLYDQPNTNGFQSQGGGISKSDDDSGSVSSSSPENHFEDDLFGRPTSSFNKPTIGKDDKTSISSGKGGKNLNFLQTRNDDGNDDLFGPTTIDFDQLGGTAASSIGDVRPTSGSKIPYGNCCPAASRGNVRYHKASTTTAAPQLASVPYSNVRDFSYQHDEQALVSQHGSRDRYVGFPPGVAVRAHVQSLDILPYGHRLPPPSVALDRLPGSRNCRSTNSRTKRSLC